jgi:phospholipase C
MRFVRRWAAVAVVAVGCATLPTDRAGLDRLEHIVIIYAENRSFDHLYGLFPGANGLARATPEQTLQVDHDGQPMASLPPVWKTGTTEPDPRPAQQAFPHRRAPDQPAAVGAGA